MRSQYCRENIDKVAQNCGLSDRTVQEVKQAADFCDQYREFSQSPTVAILALMREADEEVKGKAISLAQNFLNEETPTGGKKNEKITARWAKTFIDQASVEIRQSVHQKTKETIAPSTPQKQSGPKEVNPATVATTPEGGCRRSGGPCTLTDDQRQKYGCHLSGNLIGLHVEDARTTQDFPSTLVLKSPPNPVQSPPVVPEIVTITPTRGMWRAVDNGIKTGMIRPDAKAGKDAWQVGMMRALEMGYEALENGGRAS